MKKAILFTFLILMVSAVFATNRRVPTHQYPTIQRAINACVDGDTVIVKDGVYTGYRNMDIDFHGKAITVRSENGPEKCIIDCNGWGRGFYFGSEEDENSVLEGFTITNGYESEGGGIYCDWESSPTIKNCNIVENAGGGIYCNWKSSPTITDCIISDNVPSGRSGGSGISIFYSVCLIQNCTITGNKARSGGGIYCWNSKPTITNCTIAGNSASYYGGGIYNSEIGNSTITNCTIIGNTAGRYGGGMYHNYKSNPTIINCTIIGNTAGQNGGGMYHGWLNKPTIINCIITGNMAEAKGGGMYNIGETRPLISNCTISSNLAEEEGGGIFCRDDAEPRLTNTILWFNEDNGDIVELAQICGGNPEVTYSCIQDDDPNDMNVPFSDWDNIDDDPMFVRNPDDGGDGWGEGDNDDFGDLHLQIGSPCIEAGAPYFWAGPNNVDMDGQPRLMGIRVDIGADEFEWITTVVTRPKGGEVWVSGSQHEINWTSHRLEGMVDILFSEDNGGNWEIIESSTADIGSYIWQLPNKVDSNQCLVSVIPSVPDANIICIESGVFTIKKYPKRKPAPPGKVRKGIWRDTGLSEHYGPELGCVKWQFETDGPVSARAAIGNNRVYVACEDGKLYTLNKNDGTLIWSYDANSPLVSSPTLGYYGMVYVGSEDGKLHAINRRGKLCWTHTTDGPIYSSPVVSPDGKVYISSLDGALHALGHDGSERWGFETGGFGAVRGSIFARPAIGADGTVYIAGLYDPNLYALNPNDGNVKWACSLTDPCDPNSRAEWPFASPVLANDGTIYQTLLNDANLYAVDSNDGSITWATHLSDTDSNWFEPYLVNDNPNTPPQYNVSKSSWSEPALGPDGTIYVSFDDPYLRAVDAEGNIKWATRLGMMGGFTLTVGSDGLIYAASDDSQLYAVSPDGEEVARFEGYDWLSFPVIAADNTIIVSDANNMVWAIGGNGCEGQLANLHRPEDLNTDWIVNNIDFTLLTADWLDCTDNDKGMPCGYSGDEIYVRGDVDRSLYVDLDDLAALIERWLSEY
ncbi:MAG: outer membrane protein assembly factor BamB family protein [Planctomycetota bacterium]|jgi:parallel beta-helix repeat protein